MNFESEFNTKMLIISILGIILLGLVAYAVIPDVLSIINSKISIWFTDLINSQV